MFALRGLYHSSDDAMSDNLDKRGGQDRQRINIHQDYELLDWSRKFGVTTRQLEEAVQNVGTIAADVEAFLKKRSPAKPA